MISTDDRRQRDLGHGPLEYREVEFIPLDWLDRAAWWPGLTVFSRPVKVPYHASCRRQATRRAEDSVVSITPVDEIERLLRAALLPDTPSEPFQSIDVPEGAGTSGTP